MDNPKLLRCLELASLLNSGLRIRVKEIANRYSVSKRTIFRDLVALERTGIPIRYSKERSMHGMEEKFRLKLSCLQKDDLELLVAAVCTSELMAQPQTRRQLQASVAKLLDQCPENLQKQFSSLANSCRVDNLRRQMNEIKPEVFKDILESIGLRKQIRIFFNETAAPNCVIQTKVSPYYLVTAPERWYLFGKSTWHRKVLAFDIHAIEKVEITDDDYEIPRVFVA
jgi:predicted DNA-binding transcriptional regulator YafY